MLEPRPQHPTDPEDDDKVIIPSGKYFTGNYTSADGVTFTPMEGVTDATFIMPAKAVTVSAELAEQEEFEAIYKTYDEMDMFQEVFGTSALEGTHVQELIDCVSGFMEEGPMYFPEDQVTEDPVRFIASEIIREKILLYMEDEIPHGVAVEIEEFAEEDDLTRISACIYCERKTHKGMIIGKGGRKLKGIGKSAREELEALLGTRVFLQTWVKVKENWRDSDIALSNFGYKQQ